MFRPFLALAPAFSLLASPALAHGAFALPTKASPTKRHKHHHRAPESENRDSRKAGSSPS